MSAITGIFYRDGRKVNPELIKKINNRLSHRGLDGSAVWCEGSVALGHQMLWTTPESLHEKLPFEDEESGLVITADARIDNRDELSKELDIKDKEDVSDSYFILKAYEKWGEDCPDKLLGDFAFAIWDKNEEKLFCARDHMGVKPFYYYLSENAYFFASEMKALFSLPEVTYKLNELKVAFYLMKIRDKKLTFYENIFSLSAAYSITINQYGNTVKRYWELDPEYKIEMNSDKEYIEAFRDIFAKAVNCRLRTAFPVGFELSGGLDSSSIVCMAKKLNKDKTPQLSNINTFSMIFKGFPRADELYYIKKIISTGEIKPHFVHGEKISPLEQMETILGYQEKPFFTPFMPIIWNLYKKMHKNGIRILLSGTGGDQTVSHGNKYLRDLAVTMHWKKLIKETKAYSERIDTSFYNLFFKRVIFPLIQEFFKEGLDLYYKKRINFSILNKNFAKRLKAEKYWRDLKWRPSIEACTARKDHYYIMNTYPQQYTLEMYDRIASAFSIEPRYPYFDKRLIEFCYAIPTEIKFRSGWDRFILRVAMKDILPKEVQWRSKKGRLDDVYQKNLLLFEKDRLEQIIYTNHEIIEDYVDIDNLKDIYEKYKSGNADDNAHNIYEVALLFLWLQYSNIFKN